MVKVVKPRPVFLKGGMRAVLLLHSFTSNTRDMKQLGRYLNEQGYTCFIPIYKGHGLPPEQLIHTNPNDWWKSVEEGYYFLKQGGFQQIAVIGISLGGLFALNVGQRLNVNGIITMSVPYKKDVSSLQDRVLKFARAYKQFEGKEKNQIINEVANLEKLTLENLVSFKNHIDLTMKDLEKIKKPISIMYGELDEPLYKESAKYIQDHVFTSDISIKSYPNSKHLMTLGKDQEIIHTDVLSFLENLQW
ncbi:alpha/beta hydrolase [Bacillus mobilis]|uniref:alpha/beta hydrolase n=1 Tax=Bacillus mobilis TaxID=2026190 RepID=UPI002E22C260|nr:alpha/beta hydrolase [Bacillus mobilis]MED0993907.1 alpha/beta hydrolase [Bacillus mobilis]